MTIGDFEIYINNETFDWEISVPTYIVLQGQSDSVKNAKSQALFLFGEYLKKLQNSINTAKLNKYETGPMSAFRWYPSNTFELDQGSFHGHRVNEGDWILPEQGVVMTNDAFHNLFMRVS